LRYRNFIWISSHEIDRPHLKAGLAVWKYCQESAERIFGDATGDPVIDAIVQALKAAGDRGLTRTAIHELFGRNQSAASLNAALAELQKQGVARCDEQKTGEKGRPATVWLYERNEENELNGRGRSHLIRLVRFFRTSGECRASLSGALDEYGIALRAPSIVTSGWRVKRMKTHNAQNERVKPPRRRLLGRSRL
jgi:hypothetical protein